MSRPSRRCSSTVTGSWGKPGCAEAAAALSARPLERSAARQQFGLYSRFGAGKAKGNMQMRSFCAKSCRLSAGLQGALRRQCPALLGRPGAALWMGFAAVFPFISTFLPVTDLTRSAWKHCCESMYRGMLFCHLFWFSFYFLPVSASAGS